MYKRNSAARGAGMILSLAAAAVSLPGIAHGGPGCMNDVRKWRGGYPHSPLDPQSASGPRGRYGYYAAPAPYAARMPAPYRRPMAASQGDAAGRAELTATAAPVAGDAQPARGAAVASESESAGEAVTVRISGMRFEPANLSIKPGTRVTWLQGDRMPHVISGEAGGLRSNTLYTGQEYSYIFQQPGSYDYVCDLHPSMKGRVVVEESGTGT